MRLAPAELDTAVPRFTGSWRRGVLSVRTLCRQRGTPPAAFRDLDLFLWARRATDTTLRRVIAVEGFCDKGLRYNPFWHNDWILTE